MNFHGYTIRMTKDEDTAMVQTMLHPKFPELENFIGKIDIPKICEMSLYSLVAFSTENKMMAFAAFDDNPMATIPPGFPRDLSNKAGRWAVQAALDLGYRRQMLLWVTLCANVAAGSDEEHTLHKAMLSSVLVLSNDTMVILETSSFEFGCLKGLLKPIAHYQKQDFKLSVCACTRSFLFPKLFMRRAREEDQDDLTPVIEHAQQRGLPLTQVPESACPSKPYAVARLIAAQNKQNSVFVAQVKNRIMGVIALTSDVHLPSLHKNYDLDCFEGLMSKTIVRKLTVAATKAVDPFFVDPFAPAVSQTETEVIEEEDPATPTTETFIRWPENAFRIAMLCMEVEYESRAIDVIDFAFSKLNKEFCLVTLPYVSPYHPLLHFFYRVPARLNASNEDKELSADTRCLYLLHVDALSPGFAVRPLKPDDTGSLEELLDNFADKDRLLDTTFNPPEERLNMVAVLSNQVVGFAILDNTAPVEEIASHFDLHSLLHLQQHPFQNHASIVLYVLNPVYRYRSRLFLQEIMRQTGKSIIYCPVFPLMELPDILEDLILVPGRQHAHMATSCHWTVPAPKKDEGDNAAIEWSSSKTTSAESAPRNTAATDHDKGQNDLKDRNTLSAGDGHKKELISGTSLGEKTESNDNQKPLGVHVKNSLENIGATAGSGEKKHFCSEEQKVENVPASNAPEDAEKVSTDTEHKNAISSSFAPKQSITATTGDAQAVRLSGKEHEKELVIFESTVGNKGSNVNEMRGGAVAGDEIAKESEKLSITHNVAAKLAQEKNVESDGQKTGDLPAKPDPEKKTKHGNHKAQDVPVKVVQENNDESDISTQGCPLKSKNVEGSTKEGDLDGTQKAEDVRNVKNSDVTAIREENIDAIGDDRDKSMSNEGDPSSTPDIPVIDTEVSSVRPPTHRGYYHGFDCALYVLTHKNLYRYKTVINARVVVVGSSITTAGFLHKLVASHELQFTNLIMVSDAGFKRLSSACLRSPLADLGPKYSFPKLGLDCQVKIIKAAVKGIDRKERTVQLSNGKDLPYDWLVLSSGLQDQTKQNLQSMSELRGVVEADELILNPSEISRGATAFDGKREPVAPVVVYGATLDAFCAIRALLQEGLDGRNVLLVHPETVNVETAASRYLGDMETSQMILAALIQAGLSIHSGLKLVRAEKDATTGWINALEFQDLVEEEDLDGMSLVGTSLEKLAAKAFKPLEALEELLEAAKCPIHKVPMGDNEALKNIHVVDKSERPERKLIVPCSMLVTGNKQQVDFALFRAIHKEALIFDGRILVDGCFQTNDPLIFAAGSSCKFSRHCGDNLPKCEVFCPWEVGEALAPAVKAVIITAIYGSRTRCASEEDVEILKPHKWPRPNLPSLKKARCTGGLLPGEQWFFSATAPKFCTPVAGPPALSLNSRTPEAYCRLDIMDNKEVGRLIYYGKARLEEWKLMCFVGLPETVLQDLIERWEDDEVQDIAEYLLRPWAMTIFHDKFPSFFQSLSEEVREVMTKSRMSMTIFLTELAGGKIKSLEPRLAKHTADIVYKKLVGYLKDHGRDLPKYRTPRKAQ